MPLKPVIKKAFFFLNKKLQALTDFILLHLMYLLGVGISSLFAKIAGKHFLKMKVGRSSWEKHKKRFDPERMY